MTTEKGRITVSEETTFPSITFPASFEGAGTIGADFSTCLKLKPDDALKVLQDLRALPRGKYDVTIVSRQGAIAGDSLDREWSNMDLRSDEEAELEYAEHCIGGQCPHFAVATSGELEGAYVCQLDPEAPVRIVHGETACPLYPQAEPEGNADDDGVEHLDFEAEDAEKLPDGVGVITVSGPGVEPFTMAVGERTIFSAIVFAFAEQAGIKDVDESAWLVFDDAGCNVLCHEIIPAELHGASYTVEPAA